MCYWMCDRTFVLEYILRMCWDSLGFFSTEGVWKSQYMWAIAVVTESEEANGKDSVPDLAGLT